MKLHLHRIELPLEHPFTIARGTKTVQRCLIVELEHSEVRGYGEATEHAYYDVTLDSLTASIERSRPIIEAGDFESAAELWTMLHLPLKVTCLLWPRSTRQRMTCLANLPDARPMTCLGCSGSTFHHPAIRSASTESIGW